MCGEDREEGHLFDPCAHGNRSDESNETVHTLATDNDDSSDVECARSRLGDQNDASSDIVHRDRVLVPVPVVSQRNQGTFPSLDKRCFEAAISERMPYLRSRSSRTKRSHCKQLKKADQKTPKSRPSCHHKHRHSRHPTIDIASSTLMDEERTSDNSQTSETNTVSICYFNKVFTRKIDFCHIVSPANISSTTIVTMRVQKGDIGKRTCMFQDVRIDQYFVLKLSLDIVPIVQSSCKHSGMDIGNHLHVRVVLMFGPYRHISS